MIVKGMLNNKRPLFLVEVDLEYSKTKNGYVLPAYNGEFPENAIEFLNEYPSDYLLFANGIVDPRKPEMFRRSDGLWIRYEDQIAKRILDSINAFAERGGYPYMLSDIFRFHVEYMNQKEEHVIYALSQLIATGAIGMWKPSELGYKHETSKQEIPDPSDEDAFVDFASKHSIYCGSLALWEVDEKKFFPHLLHAHSYRKLFGRPDIDGIPVITYVERICKKRVILTLDDEFFRVLFEVALELERGEIGFLDDIPLPYTRV